VALGYLGNGVGHDRFRLCAVANVGDGGRVACERVQ
jgi:hypothetical protein